MARILTSLVCLLLSRRAGAFQQFLYGIEDLFNTTSINIIISDSFDLEFDVANINTRSPTSFMSYSTAEDASAIVELLLHQQSTARLRSRRNELLP